LAKTRPIRSTQSEETGTPVTLDTAISDADLDPKKGIVWSTHNKIMDSGLVDFTSRILESQGYAVNLENILACLETLEFNKIASEKSSYNFGVSFLLPKKTRHGTLIQQLYAELSKYGKKDQTPAAMQKKIEKLTREIQKLSATAEDRDEKLQELKTKLSLNSSGSQSQDSSTQSSSNSDIRFCKVDNLNFEKRTLDIKMNRKRLTIGMNRLANSEKLPSEGQGCIAVFHKEKIHALVVLPSNKSDSAPIESMAGRVLFSKRDEIRIRDEQRRLLTLKAHSIDEKNLFERLSRDDLLKINHVGGKILWLEPIKNQSQGKFKNFIAKKLVERTIEEERTKQLEKKHA